MDSLRRSFSVILISFCNLWFKMADISLYKKMSSISLILVITKNLSFNEIVVAPLEDWEDIRHVVERGLGGAEPPC